MGSEHLKDAAGKGGPLGEKYLGFRSAEFHMPDSRNAYTRVVEYLERNNPAPSLRLRGTPEFEGLPLASRLSVLTEDVFYATLTWCDNPCEVTGIRSYRRVFRDLETLLPLLAPSVRPGSYIEVTGENDDLCRFMFDGDSYALVRPKVTWPDPFAKKTDPEKPNPGLTFTAAGGSDHYTPRFEKGPADRLVERLIERADGYWDKHTMLGIVVHFLMEERAKGCPK